MGNQKSRVIIDTNIWISFLLTKEFKSFDTIIAHKKLILLFSQELAVDKYIFNFLFVDQLGVQPTNRNEQ
jgi:predicted nucleic acid-binding protein